MFDRFANIDQWVFDLDNTLYPASTLLFSQIETRMARFISREIGVTPAQADELRKRYWAEYGTTLAGLMAEHQMLPEAFLIDVHDIDFSALPPDPDLAQLIFSLPGQKFIYTNGTAPYAENVLKARGLDGPWDGIFGVEHANYAPKPLKSAFDQVFSVAGVDPTRAVMFEDDPRNLAVPRELGLATVLISDAPDHAAEFQTTDLRVFLGKLHQSGFLSSSSPLG